MTLGLTLELTLIGAVLSAFVLEPELMIVRSEEIRSEGKIPERRGTSLGAESRSERKMPERRGTSLGAESRSEGKMPERRGTSLGAGENFPPTGVNLGLEVALESKLVLVLDLERVFGPWLEVVFWLRREAAETAGNIVGATSATWEESSGSA